MTTLRSRKALRAVTRTYSGQAALDATQSEASSAASDAARLRAAQEQRAWIRSDLAHQMASEARRAEERRQRWPRLIAYFEGLITGFCAGAVLTLVAISWLSL
jgi:hypothetical protein